MTTYIEVAEFAPKSEALIDDLAHNGGEICLTRDGKTVAKVVPAEDAAESEVVSQPRDDGKVLYKGRWMIPAAAERECSIERMRGSVKILGDIISPIDDVEWDALK